MTYANAIHLASALFVLGCSSGTELIVDLVSDFDPGTEVNMARAELFPLDSSRLMPPRTTALSPATELIDGVRAAEWGSVPAGRWRLLIQLLDSRGVPVGTSLHEVEVRGSRLGVTSRITRDCAGVRCPASDTTAIACLGGECIDPRCAPERPEFCPAAECINDGDCAPSAVECVIPTCVAGVCFDVARDSACGPMASCHPTSGCSATPVDAAVPDAGLPDAPAPDAEMLEVLEGVTQIAAGYQHVCAILSDSSLVCWGSNEAGQLGRGDLSDPSPRAEAVMGLASATRVAAGLRRSFAIDGEGTLWVWGNNNAGTAGTGGLEPFYTTPTAITLSNVSHAGGTVGQRCAVVEDGRVYCWTTTVPREVMGLNNVTHVAVGGQHVCIVNDEQRVFCWGSNDWGQLGDSSLMDHLEPRLVVGDLAEVDELTAGDDFTCARRGGQVFCWGKNNDGQLGDGTSMWRTTPTAVLGVSDAVSISAGGRHACAVRAEGSVLCWGSNDSSQLGTGTSGGMETTPVAVDGLTDAAIVSLGSVYSCALARSERVHCWGQGGAGQLGNGSTSSSATPVLVTR